MSLEANDCHNLLKLKIKAQVCYFLLFLSVFSYEIQSDERIKRMGDTFIGMYAAELQKWWKLLDEKEEQRLKEYLHKRTIQGINTIAQMKEWAYTKVAIKHNNHADSI